MYRKLTIFILLSLCLLITACSNKEPDSNPSPDPSQTEKIEQAASEESTISPEETDSISTEAPEETSSFIEVEEGEIITPSGVDQDIKIYHLDEQAESIISDIHSTGDITPEALLDKLAEYWVVPAEVQVLNYELVTDDSGASILLDLSQEYLDHLRNNGSSTEYLVLGSLVNTFLDNLEADRIQITVEGNTLETGHADYPGYLTTFDSSL